jgi:hypothetical protein
MTLKNLVVATLAIALVATLTACATSLVAGEDKRGAVLTPADRAEPAAQQPARTADPAERNDREDKKHATHKPVEEALDYYLWKQKAQLELQSLQAQVAAKKAEIAHRESERTVQVLAQDLAVYDAMVKPVPMVFPKEVPLEDVLKHIKQETRSPVLPAGLRIYVDPQALAAAGKTMTSRVSIDLEGVPLGKTLHLALKQLGLAWQVKDGLLMISSERPAVQ